MSKLIVNQVVAKANFDIDRVENESKMDPRFRAYQDAFANSPVLKGQEGLAELCGLITGFRPRTTTSKVQPFQVFAMVSKGETRIIKYALCVTACSGSALGISSLSEAAMPFEEATCRLAEPQEAAAFIENEVARWEDTSLLTWINQKLGAVYLTGLFIELERTTPGFAPAAKK